MTPATTERELRQVLAELELCSHVSAVNMDPSSRDSSESIGGKRPPGGVDRKEDHYRDATRNSEPERVLRSAQHYRNLLAKGRPAHRVLMEAEASLEAWRKQPAAKNPVKGDPLWKQWVAESELPSNKLADMFDVKARYINDIRAKYRAAIVPSESVLH